MKGQYEPSLNGWDIKIGDEFRKILALPRISFSINYLNYLTIILSEKEYHKVACHMQEISNLM